MNAELIGKHREIVKDLVEQLPVLAESDEKPEWTLAVKSVMRLLCKHHTEEAAECHATIKNISKEWLLDVLWYMYEKTGHEWVLLGLESEWSDGKKTVVDDFCRLLATKAPIKIMLFEARGNCRLESETRRKEIITALSGVARNWAQHSVEDHFYAIDFSHGYHATYYYQVRANQRDEYFSFELLPELTGDDTGNSTVLNFKA